MEFRFGASDRATLSQSSRYTGGSEIMGRAQFSRARRAYCHCRHAHERRYVITP